MDDKEFFEEDDILHGILREIEAEKNANVKTNEEIREELLAKPAMNLDDLFSLTGNGSNYMIDGLLWEHQTVIILAKDKVGKSIFTKQMCCSMSSGTPFLGCFDVPKKFNVLYIQLEGDVDETRDRLVSMTSKVKADNKKFMFRYIPKIWLNVDKDVNSLVEQIDSLNFKPDVIVFDPIYMAKKGSLSDDSVVSDMLGNINVIKWRYKCSVIMVNHEHKTKRNSEGFTVEEGDESIMGSSLFKNNANHVIRLKIEGKDKTKHAKRILTCDTQRNGNVVESLELKLNHDPLYFYIEQETKNGFEDTYFKLLASLDKFSSKDLQKLTNISESMARKVFAKLLEQNKIVKCGSEKRVVYYKTT